MEKFYKLLLANFKNAIIALHPGQHDDKVEEVDLFHEALILSSMEITCKAMTALSARRGLSRALEEIMLEELCASVVDQYFKEKQSLLNRQESLGGKK